MDTTLVRRAAALFIEPHESATFALDSLLKGGDGLAIVRQWHVLAPHLDCEVTVDEETVLALGRLSALRWTPLAEAIAVMSTTALQALLDAGLAIGDGPAHADVRARDERLRATHWRPLAAVAHAFTRWQDVDSADDEALSGYRTLADLREKLGPPPPAVQERGPADARIALPPVPASALEALLARRVTCRNFDRTRELPRDAFAAVLRRTFGAVAEVRVADDTRVLKKLSPSGGGLHPTTAYVLAQRVEGVPAGLYHYHPVAHALEPMPMPPAAAKPGDRDALASSPGDETATTAGRRLAAFARLAVAGQHYFADAHALVLMTCRFGRSFWKYRDHAKAYRAVVLDVGHLSQTLYAAATELDLAAFVTAAINEKAIEAALGLDALAEGPIAVSGFGWRGASCDDPEFDPQGTVWR